MIYYIQIKTLCNNCSRTPSPSLRGWQQRPIEIHAKFSRQTEAIDRIINTEITLINHLSKTKKKQHVIIQCYNDSDAKTQHLERLHPFILDLHNLLQFMHFKGNPIMTRAENFCRQKQMKKGEYWISSRTKILSPVTLSTSDVDGILRRTNQQRALQNSSRGNNKNNCLVDHELICFLFFPRASTSSARRWFCFSFFFLL